MGRGLGWVTHRGPCQPRPRWDSVRPQGFHHPLSLPGSRQVGLGEPLEQQRLQATLQWLLPPPPSTRPHRGAGALTLNTSLTACISSGPTPSPGSMVTWNVPSDFAFSDCAESRDHSELLLRPSAQTGPRAREQRTTARLLAPQRTPAPTAWLRVTKIY